MSSSIQLNTVRIIATFQNRLGEPTNPDNGESVVWSVYRQISRGRVLEHTVTQTVAQAVSAGVFELVYAPQSLGTYYFESKAVVGGELQVGREPHSVTLT